MSRITEITQSVAKKFGVEKEAIDRGHLTEEWYVAIYVAKEHGLSAVSIARYFDVSDATVYNGIKAIKERMADDVALRLKVKNLLSKWAPESKDDSAETEKIASNGQDTESAKPEPSVEEVVAAVDKAVEIAKSKPDAAPDQSVLREDAEMTGPGTDAASEAERIDREMTEEADTDIRVRDRMTGEEGTLKEDNSVVWDNPCHDGHHWLRRTDVDEKDGKWPFVCRDCGRGAWFPIPPSEGDAVGWRSLTEQDVEGMVEEGRRSRLSTTQDGATLSIEDQIAEAIRRVANLFSGGDGTTFMMQEGEGEVLRARDSMTLRDMKANPLVDFNSKPGLGSRLRTAWRALRGETLPTVGWAHIAGDHGPIITLTDTGDETRVSIRVKGSGELIMYGPIDLRNLDERVAMRCGRIIQAMAEKKYRVVVE